MANGHGLGDHPLVVIIGVIAALTTIWSFVADKPPYISEPSENQQTEEEANRAHKQAEQTHSEEAQRKAQEEIRAVTQKREQQEAEAQRKHQAGQKLLGGWKQVY